jgi:RNA polymerase sigma-70 factor (ECF subfamily)
LVLYGRALGLAHAEAEDVLHDTFRALLELERPPRQPRFYLVRSFRNRVLNYRRGLWRRLQRELESRHWFEPEPDRPPRTEAAARCLTRLPPAQREVIVLKLWHELTFEAIGELLGLSPNTVAGRYRYGLQKLRNTLETPDDEPLRDPGSQPAWLPSAPALPEG